MLTWFELWRRPMIGPSVVINHWIMGLFVCSHSSWLAMVTSALKSFPVTHTYTYTHFETYIVKFKFHKFQAFQNLNWLTRATSTTAWLRFCYCALQTSPWQPFYIICFRISVYKIDWPRMENRASLVGWSKWREPNSANLLAWIENFIRSYSVVKFNPRGRCFGGNTRISLP